ncbi:hypothetical protein Peur_027892 [Populus x canadensis]|uniref:uncharacterized protein LOC133669625 n=1 Tax=Populus nigra TaxID=3691 RepID=UPI002B26BA07|nr:uncharacterized protein LOC133669625 [Populus nigra]XP_061945821.1 uncharacterized protein LOC133669625 [Populus nigra]
MKFCSSCGKKVSTTREDDEIESYNIYGKVLAFPGLRADPLFIDGEVVPRLISKIPSENISRERLYEKGAGSQRNSCSCCQGSLGGEFQELSRGTASCKGA